MIGDIVGLWPKGEEMRLVVERRADEGGGGPAREKRIVLDPFMTEIKPGDESTRMLGVCSYQNKIQAIEKDAPHEAASRFEPGDRILAVNGRSIACQSQVFNALLADLGGEVVFEILRDGAPLTFNLGSPDLQERMSLGRSLELENEGDAGYLGLDTTFPDSPAAREGVQNGDRLVRFNTTKMGSYNDLLL